MSRGVAQLRPFEPGRDGDFDTVKAAHLLNRAGFGGTPEEVAQVAACGPRRAVEQLLDFPDAPAEEQSPTDVPDLSSIEGYPRTFAERRRLLAGKTPEERQALQQKFQMANREALQAVVGWWLGRMVRGPWPLQEKLTLFWHGHFTTSARDERSAFLMWQQNELLRRQSAGNFKQFVKSISRDPAMLDYLNNSQNRKASPNENYARELMELFTLGIGNYTERDIKEAARAFTGWTHDGEQFVCRRSDHDTGEKTFFGRTGTFDGDDIIDIIFQHPAVGPYICGKLWSHFVYEDPEPEICQELGRMLREAGWDLRPVLFTMFTCRGFYSDRAIGTQIKSPIQLIVGTTRLLEVPMPPVRQLAGALDQMGQIPLAPPNVKGWPGGRAWINTSTLLVRYNTCVFLAGQGEAIRGGRVARRLMGRGRDASPDGPRVKLQGASAEDLVDEWVSRLIQRPIDPEKRRILLECISGRENEEHAIRSMIQLIVSMPEYQLC
ncbi:MAG: DUF1800 domain-containing protein [Phycisphaerales bacterium]|nr:DUF1800 domain-containing protein [Phycisphaerales bacterium]